MTARLTFVGSTCQDLHLSPDVPFEVQERGVRIGGQAETGSPLFIGLPTQLWPGMKLTADKPIDVPSVRPFLDSVEIGGGGYNQARAAAELAAALCLKERIVLIDTSTPWPALVEECEQERIALKSIGSLPPGISLIRQSAGDKTCIRGPMKPVECPPSVEPLEQLCGVIRDDEPVVIVSPKCPALARAAARATGFRHLVFQPTGSLPVEDTLELVHEADMLACNFEELGLLAKAVHLPWLEISELSPLAPAQAVATVEALRAKEVFNGRFAATTLGRAGNVVTDFESGQSRWNRIVTRAGRTPDTRSGSGDRWLATMVVHHRLLGLPLVQVARLASDSVAQWLGLAPGSYELETQPVSGVASQPETACILRPGNRNVCSV